MEQHEQILKFIEGTVAEGAPVIPISAQLKYNIEVGVSQLQTTRWTRPIDKLMDPYKDRL